MAKTSVLQPLTWWGFGLASAVAAGVSANMPFLLSMCAAMVTLMLAFRTRNALRIYLVLSTFVVVVRVLFRVIFTYNSDGATAGANSGLAGIQLPNITVALGPLGEVHFLGFMAYSSLQSALLEGFRMAAILMCIGMANSLANPRALLKSTPNAFYELAAALAMATNLAPQLVESSKRVRKASRLRGRSSQLGSLKSWVIPTLEDTLEKSLALAASMDARGFGRRGPQTRQALLWSRFSAFVSASCLAIGAFTLLTQPNPTIGISLVAEGLALLLFSIRAGNTGRLRTSYTKAVWHIQDFAILGTSFTLLTVALLGGFR